MKATLEKLDNDRVSLEIEVDSEQVDSALEQAFRQVVKDVTVPGFRKGRVPRPVFERYYGVAVLYERALDELIPKAYREAVEQTQIEPIDQPTLDVVEFEAGKPFRFKAEVQVKPEVKLGEYKGVAAKRVRVRVTDEDVEAVLERYRQAQAQLVVPERSVVEEGDYAVIDFEGFIDGKPFQGGAAKDFHLQIGSGAMIPGFEEQLVGVSVGEPVEITVTFPEGYRVEELAGKEATFKVTVSEIKVREVPPLDDELAKLVSDKETLAELRQMVRENLEREADRRAEEAVREEVVRIVTDAADVHIPAVMVERELESMINETRRNFFLGGMDLDTYLEHSDMTLDSLKESMTEDAERRVKTSLVLEAVAKAEGLDVTDEEIDAHIEELVSVEGEHEDEARETLNQPGARSVIKDRLLVRKTIDLLVQHAEITEEEVDPDDVAAKGEGAEESASPNDAAEAAAGNQGADDVPADGAEQEDAERTES